VRRDSPIGGRLLIAARAGMVTVLGLAAVGGALVGHTERPATATAARSSVAMAPAATQVGSPCTRVWHRRWSARVCASMSVGHDRLGNQRVRAAATARAWRWWRDAHGRWHARRRALGFAMTVRLCGPGFCQATRHRAGWARRLRTRTGWRVVVDPTPVWARARVVVTFPDGARRVVTATSAPRQPGALRVAAPSAARNQQSLALAPRRAGDLLAGPRRSRRPPRLACSASPSSVQRLPSTGFGSWAPRAADGRPAGC
jgi:hypothetical protein